jgi:hypothetical protein
VVADRGSISLSKPWLARSKALEHACSIFGIMPLARPIVMAVLSQFDLDDSVYLCEGEHQCLSDLVVLLASTSSARRDAEPCVCLGHRC